LHWFGEDNSDFPTLFKDPGYEFKSGNRWMVLLRVSGQIRFIAGPIHHCSGDIEKQYEVGVFRSEADALAFGVEYLVHQVALSQITIERQRR
jgi:hypothetical protein